MKIAQRCGASSAAAAAGIILIVIVILAGAVVVIQPNPVADAIKTALGLSANGLSVKMNVVILAANGTRFILSQDNRVIPMTISALGISNVNQIQWSPSAVISYSGTIVSSSSNTCSESWTPITAVGTSYSITPAATSPTSIPSTLASGGTLPLPNAYVYNTQLSVGSTGTYTATAMVTVTCTLAFADGSTSTKAASSLLTGIQYTYSTSGITALSVSFTTSAS